MAKADGVFGNLPSTRPGARSPRRGPDPVGTEPQKGAVEPEPVHLAAKAEAEPSPAPSVEAQPSRPAEPSSTAPPQAPAPGINGVEDLAWAGVAVAAQAATAGVRFASRAFDAARKSIDRP